MEGRTGSTGGEGDAQAAFPQSRAGGPVHPSRAGGSLLRSMASKISFFKPSFLAAGYSGFAKSKTFWESPKRPVDAADGAEAPSEAEPAEAIRDNLPGGHEGVGDADTGKSQETRVLV